MTKMLNLCYVRMLCGNDWKKRKPVLLGMASNKQVID
jgi:hypothetical protein